jgi:hypothetical protein
MDGAGDWKQRSLCCCCCCCCCHCWYGRRSAQPRPPASLPARSGGAGLTPTPASSHDRPRRDRRGTTRRGGLPSSPACSAAARSRARSRPARLAASRRRTRCGGAGAWPALCGDLRAACSEPRGQPKRRTPGMPRSRIGPPLRIGAAQVARAALGGLLVGVGSSLGNGCTSGHGGRRRLVRSPTQKEAGPAAGLSNTPKTAAPVCPCIPSVCDPAVRPRAGAAAPLRHRPAGICGNARLSPRSFAYTLIFMVGAALRARLAPRPNLGQTRCWPGTFQNRQHGPPDAAAASLTNQQAAGAAAATLTGSAAALGVAPQRPPLVLSPSDVVTSQVCVWGGRREGGWLSSEGFACKAQRVRPDSADRAGLSLATTAPPGRHAAGHGRAGGRRVRGRRAPRRGGGPPAGGGAAHRAGHGRPLRLGADLQVRGGPAADAGRNGRGVSGFAAASTGPGRAGPDCIADMARSRWCGAASASAAARRPAGWGSAVPLGRRKRPPSPLTAPWYPQPRSRRSSPPWPPAGTPPWPL